MAAFWIRNMVTGTLYVPRTPSRGSVALWFLVGFGRWQVLGRDGRLPKRALEARSPSSSSSTMPEFQPWPGALMTTSPGGGPPSRPQNPLLSCPLPPLPRSGTGFAAAGPWTFSIFRGFLDPALWVVASVCSHQDPE